jgi:hypothetical protein
MLIFLDWQVLLKLYIIGVFISSVNGKPFLNSRHYGGVFYIQLNSAVIAPDDGTVFFRPIVILTPCHPERNAVEPKDPIGPPLSS